jgi:DNA-binding MurR/RpiR family transcriptional regulator
MKMNMSTDNLGWSAGATRHFADSPLGQQVMARMREGSKSQRALSDFILRNPVFVATHGIEDISGAAGISASTISRYVRDLGMDSYAAFRADVADRVQSLIAPVTKLESRLAQGAQGVSASEASLASARAQLEGLADAASMDAVRKATAVLCEARQVWVIGFGLSAHLAAILTLGLQPYRDGVVNVVQYGGTEVAAGRLISAGAGDVVVAISFPRYSRDVTELAKTAQTMGAKLVALTDSPASPLAQVCDHLLLAPAHHPILSSSCLPGLALIEALLAEFLLSDPAHVERAGRMAAIMSAYLDDGGT